MPTTGYSLSVIGGREMNQDSFLVSDRTGIYAVADGVGGGLKGEVASQMAVEGIATLPETEVRLSPHIEKIQQAILKEAIDTLGEAVMGTTLTAVRIQGNTATFGHVGDSHLYHFTEDTLKLLNIDHELFDEGVGGTVLVSYLGIDSDVHPLQIQEKTFTVAPGDKLILCSDGLYRQISEQRMIELLRQYAKEPNNMLAAMCAEASAVPHSDNVTVVLVEVE